MPVEKTASPSACPILPNGVPVKTRPSSSTSTALLTSAAPPHRFVPRKRAVPPLHRRRRGSRVHPATRCPAAGLARRCPVAKAALAQGREVADRASIAGQQGVGGVLPGEGGRVRGGRA